MAPTCPGPIPTGPSAPTFRLLGNCWEPLQEGVRNGQFEYLCILRIAVVQWPQCPTTQ